MSADAERDRVVAYLREQALRCERNHLLRWNPFCRRWMRYSIAYDCAATALSRNAHRAP